MGHNVPCIVLFSCVYCVIYQWILWDGNIFNMCSLSLFNFVCLNMVLFHFMCVIFLCVYVIVFHLCMQNIVIRMQMESNDLPSQLARKCDRIV
eukprot:UN09522